MYTRMENQSDGGWQPVVRRHSRRGVWNSWANVSIYSVFVDNLPEAMRAKGLYSIFSNYGVVVDTFIPNKRRKLTRSRFGFVRYNCSVAADMAVQRANGLWCDDKALKVKMADFAKDYGMKYKAGSTMQSRKFAEEPTRTRAGYQGKRSFAEVVSDKLAGPNTTCTIKAFEEGNGWLYESVIARLKPFLAVEAFQKEIAIRDLGEVQVRVGGGRDLVLSFPSKEVMKEKLMFMKSWLNEWCDSVLEWKQGMSLAQERHVWLSCYGVPLNLWNCNTFINIGKVWGVVSALDEDTRNLNHFQYGKVKIVTSFMEPINQILNLECKGVLYPVRVCEEVNQIANRRSKHEKDDDHVAILDGNEVDPSAEVERIATVMMVCFAEFECLGGRLSVVVGCLFCWSAGCMG